MGEVKGATCFLDFSEFFLPDGVFQRLVCLCAEYARNSEKRSLRPKVKRKAALLSFGYNPFRLDVQGDVIKIVVDKKAEDTAKTIKLLVSMFQKLKDDVMSERLKWKLVLQSPASNGAKVEYTEAAEAWKQGESKSWGLDGDLVELSEFQLFFSNNLGSLVDDSDNGVVDDKDKPLSLPDGCKHHVFLSHTQTTAGDAVHVLSLLLKARGIEVWYDQSMEKLAKQDMERGIKESACFLLFLSVGVMESKYCQFEMKTALKQKKPILLMYEADSKKAGYQDFEKYIEAAPREMAETFEKAESMEFQRRYFLRDAMVNELIRRIEQHF